MELASAMDFGPEHQEAITTPAKTVSRDGNVELTYQKAFIEGWLQRANLLHEETPIVKANAI